MAEASLPEALRGSASSGRGGRHPGGWVIDESDYLDYGRYYAEYDDDEEVEDYFFSSAAGRARVVIGNRRHGPNGFLSSGRLQARTWGATQQQAKVGQAGGEWWETRGGVCWYTWKADAWVLAKRFFTHSKRVIRRGRSAKSVSVYHMHGIEARRVWGDQPCGSQPLAAVKEEDGSAFSSHIQAD